MATPRALVPISDEEAAKRSNHGEAEERGSPRSLRDNHDATNNAPTTAKDAQRPSFLRRALDASTSCNYGRRGEPASDHPVGGTGLTWRTRRGPDGPVPE